MANQDQEKDTGLVGKKGDITDSELMELQAQTTQRQRLKTDLSEFEAAIKKMMEVDISLPLVLGWLGNKGKTTTLPALRRYIRNAFGEKFYNDFATRNGWQKTKKGAKPQREKALDEKNFGRRSTDDLPAHRPEQNPVRPLTVEEMKQGLHSNSIDPTDFD